MANRGQSLFLRVFDSTNTYQRWQSYYVNQTVTWSAASWEYHPFTVNAFTSSTGAPNSELSIDIPATKAAVDLFTYALSFNWFCEVKLYEFNAQLSQAGPPSGQTLIASVIGEVTGINGSFTSLTVLLGSGLAPVGSQVPPRTFTTALIGAPLRV